MLKSQGDQASKESGPNRHKRHGHHLRAKGGEFSEELKIESSEDGKPEGDHAYRANAAFIK